MTLDATHEPALAKLLEVYEQRPDLQESFPEVVSGDSRRLIDWAAGASGKQWTDGSQAALEPHATWYAEHFTGTPPHVSRLLPTILRTSGESANPLPLTLAIMQEESTSDISHHLLILSLLVTEFGLKHIVELGTRNGHSTLALLEAVQQIGGKVMSVDIEPCLTARRRVAEAGLNTRWEFLHANDLELESAKILQPIDLLFIDTNHLYAQTIAELRKYLPYLTEGSWIALHDYTSFEGVNHAVDEFVRELPGKPTFYPFLNQNGFALIRLHSPDPLAIHSRMKQLSERVSGLEERIDRYVAAWPLRWARRVRAAVLRLPPSP
jgi:predicted O-methyltransferase YrrM